MLIDPKSINKNHEEREDRDTDPAPPPASWVLEPGMMAIELETHARGILDIVECVIDQKLCKFWQFYAFCPSNNNTKFAFKREFMTPAYVMSHFVPSDYVAIV